MAANQPVNLSGTQYVVLCILFVLGGMGLITLVTLVVVGLHRWVSATRPRRVHAARRGWPHLPGAPPPGAGHGQSSAVPAAALGREILARHKVVARRRWSNFAAAWKDLLVDGPDEPGGMDRPDDEGARRI